MQRNWSVEGMWLSCDASIERQRALDAFFWFIRFLCNNLTFGRRDNGVLPNRVEGMPMSDR